MNMKYIYKTKRIRQTINQKRERIVVATRSVAFVFGLYINIYKYILLNDMRNS